MSDHRGTEEDDDADSSGAAEGNDELDEFRASRPWRAAAAAGGVESLGEAYGIRFVSSALAAAAEFGKFF